jgi:hypothetical protein
LGGLAAAGAWLAMSYGRSPWWGITLPLGINAGLAALHNLTDPLSTLAVFGLLIAWPRGRPWLLALCGAAALLSREQNIAVVVVVAGVSLWHRRHAQAAGLLCSVLIWGAWVVAVSIGYHTWPFLTGNGNFALPLSGMAYRWTHPGGNDHFSRRLAIIMISSMCHLTLLIGLALYLAARRREGVVSLCMLAGVGLALLCGPNIYNDFWCYTRAFVWLPMGIWILALRHRLRWAQWALVPSVLWTLVSALNYT